MRESFRLKTSYITRFEAESPRAAERMARAIQEGQLSAGKRAEGARVVAGEYGLVNETRDNKPMPIGAAHATQDWKDRLHATLIVALGFGLLFAGLRGSTLAVFVAGGLILWLQHGKDAARRARPNA